MRFGEISAILMLLIRALSQVSPANCNVVDENNHDDLVSWIRSMGGFIDPRQEVRLPYPVIDKDSPANVRGIFATETIKRGDKLLDVPWDDTIIGPELSEPDAGNPCTSAMSLRHKLSLNDSKYGPYVELLKRTARTDLKIPNAWSADGLALLDHILGDHLTPTDTRRHLRWWEFHCGQNIYSDRLGAEAALLQVTRAVEVEGVSLMVPFYDLYNHRNGEWENTVVVGDLPGKKFQVFAKRDIEKGEQIYNSYGTGTDHLFRDYGFVEKSPQLWTFTITDDPRRQVSFWLFIENKENKGQKNIVIWQTEPSLKAEGDAIHFFQTQDQRLSLVKASFENDMDELSNIPMDELESIWLYHEALSNALFAAHEDLRESMNKRAAKNNEF